MNTSENKERYTPLSIILDYYANIPMWYIQTISFLFYVPGLKYTNHIFNFKGHDNNTFCSYEKWTIQFIETNCNYFQTYKNKTFYRNFSELATPKRFH